MRGEIVRNIDSLVPRLECCFEPFADAHGKSAKILLHFVTLQDDALPLYMLLFYHDPPAL